MHCCVDGSVFHAWVSQIGVQFLDGQFTWSRHGCISWHGCGFGRRFSYFDGGDCSPARHSATSRRSNAASCSEKSIGFCIWLRSNIALTNWLLHSAQNVLTFIPHRRIPSIGQWFGHPKASDGDPPWKWHMIPVAFWVGTYAHMSILRTPYFYWSISGDDSSSCCATPTGILTATWDRSTDPLPDLNTFSTWYSLMGPNPRCWINSSKAVNVVSSRSQSPLLHSQVIVRDPTAKFREPQWLPQRQELHPRPGHHPFQLRHSWQPFALAPSAL